MSTHVYSSYVNIPDLHIGHVGSKVQIIFLLIILLAPAVVDKQH